ncbi:YoaK family protein [Streptomyces sp. MI02-7b]|uniref:YoaK family protein n=1 Tax=Streptomyces sp. MI02-7b TaxID=462941 RepID=UPI0029BCAC0F|nr:YoaK family protein [Streptomyces sp. MI02-7b]MDX3076782.1 YoaK family protein [Streptomyces sp. MI02-7b]
MEPTLGRAAARLFPGTPGHHGVLPPLLVVLTFVTGVVDAVSYLGLGRVFVANMTGNVVFLGFALAGDHALSAVASVAAGAAFFAGAAAGGRLVLRVAHPVRLFTLLVAAHAVLVAAAIGACAAGTSRYVPIALLALGMGLQNAVVRKLAVPDLTTTVLTLTVTGLAADRPGPATPRRVLSVAAMFAGALTGGLLQIRCGNAVALAPALLLLAAVALAAVPGSRE